MPNKELRIPFVIDYGPFSILFKMYEVNMKEGLLTIDCEYYDRDLLLVYTYVDIYQLINGEKKYCHF